ncbi:polysaccharide biosynthesis protein [Anaerocolumna aminovalerica]|uniref:polysaccharide biosynthesis protein n=1 Tax=Anaerocolumna aminovalerica TaxID=1527 RepID=UPI001C0ED203|nr:nucleoside-diphosphate sugar epimerase/dehydratase [Anaerocolumna aminovalerica]MBU5331128.1 polysaccharide biosynthesis protein [Anaerocolumna aminovalerica]
MLKNIIDKKLTIRRFFIIIADIVIILVSSGMGLLLRFDLEINKINPIYIESVWNYLPINMVTTFIIFYLFKLYHSLWVFAGVTEMQNVFSACVVASAVQLIGMEILDYQVPRSYYFLYGGVLLLLTIGSRFAYRLIRIQIHKKKNNSTATINKIMIIGGGNAANTIIREIKSSDHINHMEVKCIIDDDINKQGKYIHGIKVVGARNNIKECVTLYNIDEIIIAMPSVTKKEIREIVEICKETECSLKILPGIYQLMNGEVSVSKLRNVEIEDLLGREPVKVDLNSIMGYIKNKIILVTGGGGSIGSELCRQLAAHGPKQLIIIDIYENNAYEIQQELKGRYPNLNLVVLVASVRNEKRIDSIFETYKPDIVYHAAAHKHVPLMEDSPNEAIKNNVIGTWNTVLAADKYGVKRFVMISTDKAVNPTNIMGASKRICEMIIQTYDKKSKTEFVAVRFGNVLGSNGSVIPLFKKQIAAGGPVTVTHPDIIRYFMIIPEAVSLVLQAGAYAKGGEIFVLDMGEPVKILDLALNLIQLSGYVPYEEIRIEFTGLRPGEKLYEELLMDEEGLQETENKLIHIGKPIEIDEARFIGQLNELKQLCYSETKDIRGKIKDIVPSYLIKERKHSILQFSNSIDIKDESCSDQSKYFKRII